MKKIKYFIPLIVFVLVLVVVSIITYPLITMETKDIDVAVVQLDEGIENGSASVNAGEKIISTLKSSSVLEIKELKTEQSLTKNIEKYYAGIIIPSDFTKESINGNPEIEVIINQGKHPMVSNILTQMFNNMENVKINVKTINEIPSELGFRSMILPMAIALFALIPSLLSAFVITSIFKLDKTKKLKSFLFQYSYMFLGALLIGFFAVMFTKSFINIDIDVLNTGLFLSFVSFVLMVLVNGCVNLFGKKGMVIPLLVFVLGIASLQLPYEFLTEGFQFIVASWEPLRYIGEGIREVLYQNGNLYNSAFPCLCIVFVVGLALTIIKLFLKKYSLNSK